MSSSDKIGALVRDVLPRAIELRHEIHRNPEMALREWETSKLVRGELDALGIRLLDPLLETAVVGILDGHDCGRHVVLRADMDALPLVEKTGVAYTSRRDGIMHACGHDGHTATLLGAAMVLAGLRDDFRGSIKFVFQPGEEVVGAGRDLVEKGVLADPRPDGVYALHCWNTLPVGAIAGRTGCMLAAAEFFQLTVLGKGAHGSKPEQCIDPILTAARIVDGLQALVSRRVSPLDPAVLSICRISGGTNGNIIPDSVELEGTVRYLNPELGKKMRGWLEQTVKGICDSMGAGYELRHDRGYMPTINHADAVALGRKTVEEVWGLETWIEKEHPSMGGEDFAYYLADNPGAIFFLGMGEDAPSLHNACFDFNDQALGNGVRFLVELALRTLE